MPAFEWITDQFILKGVNQGLSANTIQRMLTAQGLGVRRTDLLARVRQLKDVPQKASLLRYVNNDKYPTSNLLTPGGNYQQHNYVYHVRFDVYGSALPGESDTLYQIVSSDVPLTVGEAKSIALDRLPFTNPAYDFKVGGQAVELAYIRQGITTG